MSEKEMMACKKTFISCRYRMGKSLKKNQSKKQQFHQQQYQKEECRWRNNKNVLWNILELINNDDYGTKKYVANCRDFDAENEPAIMDDERSVHNFFTKQ